MNSSPLLLQGGRQWGACNVGRSSTLTACACPLPAPTASSPHFPSACALPPVPFLPQALVFSSLPPPSLCCLFSLQLLLPALPPPHMPLLHTGRLYPLGHGAYPSPAPIATMWVACCCSGARLGLCSAL